MIIIPASRKLTLRSIAARASCWSTLPSCTISSGTRGARSASDPSARRRSGRGRRREGRRPEAQPNRNRGVAGSGIVRRHECVHDPHPTDSVPVRQPFRLHAGPPPTGRTSSNDLPRLRHQRHLGLVRAPRAAPSPAPPAAAGSSRPRTAARPGSTSRRSPAATPAAAASPAPTARTTRRAAPPADALRRDGTRRHHNDTAPGTPPGPSRIPEGRGRLGPLPGRLRATGLVTPPGVNPQSRMRRSRAILHESGVSSSWTTAR